MTEINEDDARAMRQQGDLKGFILAGMRDGAIRNKHRRGLVLAHADLAAKLTEPPLSFSSPEKWTGYIPPALTAEGAINPSPVRAALAALIAEAEKRAAVRPPAQGWRAS